MTLSWLTSDQAILLLETHGENALPEKKPPTQLQILFAQLNSPLVYILLIAAIITWILGDHEDTVIIGVAVWLNTILGWYQESKAWSELEALKKMLQSTTRVIRDWKKIHIPTELIVPWDIVQLKAGEKVPADGQVIEANRLFMMEAMLTGESVAIEKQIDDTVFMWTIVQWWQAIFRVVYTWAHTEMGKIATNLQDSDSLTPLQKQLNTFSKQLTWVVLGVSLLVFVIWWLKWQALIEMFTTAVALAVWAIPEWLLVALTAVLAIGMQRILKKKWLVKSLTSAETLGWVTVICSDKTWTLTQWTMSVIEVQWDLDDLSLQAGIANDEDNAVWIATAEWSKTHSDTKQLLKTYPRIDSIPFSSENKFFACLNSYSDKENMLFINWAPDYLLEWTTLDTKEKQKIKKQIDELTALGYRLVAYARKKVPASYTKIDEADIREELEWIWFLGMSDPVRVDVKDALAKTKKAWIKLIVITWDFANTAQHIMHQLWVDVTQEHIMLWTQLAELSDTELGDWLEKDGDVKLFARTKPEQKMRIVDELKADGEVVAMMGDGVNDAPALKKADIWIVVNQATDVAKESADLILLDSSFNTIVDAVEEWRWMFDNIRKIILFLMCDAFVQIIAIIIALLTGNPHPMTAAQILWNNLVSDGPPSLAMTVDPKRSWLMTVPPRSPKIALISGWIMQLIGIVSASAAVVGFLLFKYVLDTTGDLILARSVWFACFGLTTLFYVFSVRTLKKWVWTENVFDNLWLIWALILDLWLVLAPYFRAPLGNFLDVVPIGNRWFAAIACALSIVVLIEIFKAYFRQVSQEHTPGVVA